MPYYKGIMWGESELAELLGCRVRELPEILANIRKARRTRLALPTREEALDITMAHRIPDTNVEPDVVAPGPKRIGSGNSHTIRVVFTCGTAETFGSLLALGERFGVSGSAAYDALKRGVWKKYNVATLDRVYNV